MLSRVRQLVTFFLLISAFISEISCYHSAGNLIQDTNSRINSLSFESAIADQPLQAELLRTDDHLVAWQGQTLPIYIKVNRAPKTIVVSALSRKINCFSSLARELTYECFLPVACETAPASYPLRITLSDYDGRDLEVVRDIEINAFQFKHQYLAWRPKKKRTKQFTPLVPPKELRDDLLALLSKSPFEKLWEGKFIVPTKIRRISTEFGTIRKTPMKEPYAHGGLDIVNRRGAPVWSPQKGIVIIKDRYWGSGRTVVVDHGYGIFSLFFHLNSFAKINIGETIERGQILGTIGTTGRSTGPHLHWEMRVSNVQVDPMQWTKKRFFLGG